VKNNFDSCLKRLLQHEGGYSNHPADKGGMTNLGVTKAVWEEWTGHKVDEAVMRKLTQADVAPLYKRKYWDKVCGDDLPAGVDYCAFDAAVNSGPGRAAKWLQEAVGVTPDGAIGPKTLAAVAKADDQETIDKFNSARLRFLQSLPTWATFGNGWGRRVDDVNRTATTMIA
jgi:lysozyme family protein